jgi:hypothetical protein
LRFSTAPTGIRRGSAENGFRVNGEPRTVAQLRSEIERLDGYTADGFVRQHLSVGRFNPVTLNTLRLVTTRNPDSKEPFIAGAVLRIGTSRSWPVDSFARGDLPGFKGSSQRLPASIVAPRQRLRRAFSSQGSFAVWH